MNYFVKRTEKKDGYRLVEHPVQKPKVGIVPYEVEFKFSEFERTAPFTEDPPEATHFVSERERAVLSFLRSLSHLSEQEIDSVVIPTRVLTKLLARR